MLQLSGQTQVGGKAQVTAEEGQFDGLLKAQSLVLAVNQAKSDGKLHSREGLQWLGQQLTTGQNSELIANQGVTLSGEVLTLGGTIGAGNALNIQGKEVSQSGALVSGQAMVIKADDLSLAGQVQGQSVQLTSDRGRQHGRLLASDNLVWQSSQLEGNGWMQAGADLTLSGDTLIHKGTALAQGRMALDFSELSSQGGLFAQDMALTGSRLILQGTLETTQGAQLQGDTLQLGGESRIGTDLTLGATLLSLSGTQQIGGALQIGAKEADLNGELEVGADLNVKAETLRSVGKVLAKQADIDAGQWDQLGSLATDDTLVWRGTRLTQQDKGVLQAGGQLSLAGKTVNLAGTLAAKENVGITADNYIQLGTLNTAQGLSIDADKLQLGGSTQARTAALQSREGLSSGQHLIADGFTWQSDELTNKGWLQAGKDLTLTTRTLDNDGTLIAASKHSIEAQERLTNQGSLAGNQLSLTSKELQNSGLLQGKQGVELSAERAILTGRLTSQGAVQLGANLLALGGNADIGGSLTLKGDEQQLAGNWRVGGLLQSTGKQLTLDGDWQASQWQLLADTLVNKGRLASEQTANFNVGAVHNQQGATLVAGGPLTLVGKSLLQEGSWLGAGDQSIKVDDVQQHGQWVGDGALQMEGSQFNNSGALRAASMGLAFEQLTNRGRMESLGEFGWEGKQWHNLGALIAKGATLSGQHLINSGDVGVHRLTMVATDRLENNGVLVGKDLINLNAATLDSQGDMLSSGDLTLEADALTLGGLTQAKNQLALTTGKATLAGNVVADRLQWSGQHLAMGGTTVAREAELSGTQISLEGTLKGDRQTLEAGTLTTGKTSSLLAKEKQQLKADQMTLQGSIVAGLQQKILATALTQQGVLASGGSLALQVADTLHNEGKISSETLALEAGHIDNGGVLVSKGALALKTGDLINRGHWQSDQGITLTATRLLNSGHWISGLAQSLTLDELDNSGTLQSGSAMTLTAEHLDSRGKLLANQDMSLTADEIILENGSTTASNGRLALHAADVSSAGMLSAADDLSWQGQSFNHSGTTVTDGVLRLEGEALTLDGALQGGTVTLKTNNLTTGGSLNSQGNLVVNARGAVQHGGQLQGGNLVLNSASWQGAGTLGSNGTLTLRTGQLQQQGPWRILGVTDIQADTVRLNGSLISGGDLTLLSRGDLSSKSGSQLVSGGNLSVEGKLLTQQGLWQSERAMQIKSSRVEQQGDLLAGTDLGLRSGSWQQSGKTRANGTLNAIFTEDSVLAGTVQADGGILLSAPSLTLKGTLASKGNVNLTTASQLSQLGNLLSGGELTLGAARIDQQGRIEAGSLQSRGELQNDGIMLVAGQGSLSGARLDNRGTLQGDGLTITSAQLDNRGALLANNLAIINAGVQNRGRVQGGSVRLETQSLDNQQGAVLRAQNQGDISATTLSNASELSSGNSLFLKGNLLSNSGLVSANWLEASPLARLVNTGILFGQQLTLRSNDIHAPGKILAGQKATLEAGQVTGIGEWLSGGDLSLKVGSSLNSQGTLSAKGILDLQVQGNWQHQGQWGAGQRFHAGVSGQLTNSGALVSNGVMQLSAQRLENNGSVQSGQGLTLNTQGELRNTGLIASNGDMGWQGDSLYNRGTIYSGGTQNLTANSNLANEYGTILAERDANIRVNNGSITNSSGIIEASGSLMLTANDILNQRAKFVVSRQGGESAQPPQTKVVMPTLSVSVRGGAADHDDQYTIWANYSRTVAEAVTGAEIRVSEASAEGQITAGQHLQLASTHLNNVYSNITAGGNITIQSGDVKNESLSEGKVELQLEYGPADGFGLRKVVGGGRGSGPSDPGAPKASLAATYVLRAVNEVQLEAGRKFNSIISAGGNLTGTVAGMIDNVTIKANAGPVSTTTQRPGMSLPQAGGAGTAPGLQGDAQYLSQVLKPVGPDNGVPMPDFQLPSGDKGLFTINDSGDNPYLIEVNPLLANLGQSGNGMMDRIDAALQQQLQGTGQLSFDSISGNGGITEANGQNANWSLPGRVIGEAASPDFQDLNGVKPVNNGHATVSQQWQQSLQPGFDSNVQGPQVGSGVTGVSGKWQQSLQQGFNPSGQGPHISGGHSGSTGQWEQSLQDGFTHAGSGPQVSGGGGQVAGQWQQSLQNGWQGQPVSGVTVTMPGSVQISSQPAPAVVTAPVVETSPVLTQVDQFLGSNYFFDQVNFTPEKDIKLLGDAAFDTRVIRDAVLAQTGRRFINNEMGSDLAQMKALIDNAAKNQRELGLSPGVALSAEQVAQLGRSMVWWEPVWYQGKVVLAPKLYLTEADKRHLSGSVITAANIDLTAGGINNSGTLLADGTLSLKSGSTLVNQGQIQAGGRLELIAKGDILNQNLIKGGDVTIASLDGSIRNETQTAQRHVDVNGVLSSELTDQTRFSRTDVGDIARIESTGNLLLQAGQDISLSASNLLAGLDMSLSAGRDITIGSLEDRSKWEEGQNRFTRVEQMMSSLDAGRSLVLSADRDLNISATSLTAKGDALLQAGNELNLKTADNQASLHTTRRNGYDIERQSEEVGVNLTASNIALRSGGDLNLRAASVQAAEQLSATAGRDLLVESGETTDYRESYTKETKKKAFSKKTTTTHDIVEQHAAQASDLGGQYVLLKAQQDMDIKGSNVVGDLGATLLAGRDLNISAVDLLSREMHFSETKRSGLMGGGGLGVTIGKQQQSSDMMGTTLAKEGSSVGSVQGNVTLQAGNQLVVAGSDVIAGKDILMTGKDVAILSEQQIITRKEEFKSQKSGLTLALTGGAVTAVQAAYDTAKTSKESSNDRLVALQGTKAAMSGYQAWEASQLSSGSPGGVPDASFIGIAISVGNQRSHSSNQSSESNAFTSEVNAGGDVTIVAKGDAANTSGDLLMTGSSVKGQNVTLGAARDLVLQSAVNSSDSKGSNHSSGWNVGLSIGVSQGSFGISIFANMNAAKGKENGDSDRYTETNVTAGNALTLTSGRDATLLGAMVSGDKVSADIGRNLTLTSQQDNDHYQSKQSSIAAGGSFTFGSMSGSGYINASRQKINSDFESVVEQTGVFAGKQGFDIRVGEHTQLNGAVLAGSEDDSKNRLSTGTLGWSDLANRADYKVESQSIGISGSGGSKEEGFSGKGKPTAATMLGGGNSSGSASSTTHASISAGQIEIRNEEAQQQDLVTLHRDPTQAANGLSPIFDKQKELERMQEAQMIGEVGQQATQLVVTKYLGKANEQAKEDPEYAQSKEYKELQAKWGVGSDFQRGMQAATAALQGLAGGNITQAAAGAAAPYLAQLIKQQTPEGPSRVMAHALVQGALAAAQNKNAMVSATGAATGELVGMLATELYHKEASQLTEGEKETVSTLATLAAGLAGGLTGDSSTEVLAGAQTGKTVVENNWLSQIESRQFDKELSDCKESGGDCSRVIEKYINKSNENSKKLANSCTGGGVTCVSWEDFIQANTNVAMDADPQQIRLSEKLKDPDAAAIVKYLNGTDLKFLKDNITTGDRIMDVVLTPTSWPVALMGGKAIITNAVKNTKEQLIAVGVAGAANAGIQYGVTGEIKLSDVLGSVILGGITAGKGYNPTVSWNAAGGYYQAEISGDDPFMAALLSKTGASAGYAAGNVIKVPFDKKLNPISKQYEWAPTGVWTITKPVPQHPLPSIVGNIGDSAVSGMVEDKLEGGGK
ncbi:hemagglutinin repeat-containing protein [Aeromonas lusitana]